MTTETQITKTEPKKRSAALAIKEWMTAPAMQSALRAALAGYMDETTFAAQCYLAAQDPKLADCSAESLFRAFLECAQMGVLPGAHHRHVALIPRAGVVVAQPQWQGFKFLMERQPGVKRVLPVLVHVRDTFAYTNGVLQHEFDPFDDERVFEHPTTADKAKRKGGLRGGYLIIEREDAEAEYHFVSAAKIDRNRLCAETQSVWMKWFPEQCLKTVIRDAWARRVISIDPQLEARVGHADAVDNLALGNDPVRGSLPTASASRVAALADRVAGKTIAVSDEHLPDLTTAGASATVESDDDPEDDGPHGGGKSGTDSEGGIADDADARAASAATTATATRASDPAAQARALLSIAQQRNAPRTPREFRARIADYDPIHCARSWALYRGCFEGQDALDVEDAARTRIRAFHEYAELAACDALMRDAVLGRAMPAAKAATTKRRAA